MLVQQQKEVHAMVDSVEGTRVVEDLQVREGTAPDPVEAEGDAE